MTIDVRTADLHADAPLAVDMFARYLNPGYDAARFDWLYRRNPAGAGRLWLATDRRTGEPVGTAGACPRWMYVAGRDRLAWVLTDFCVASRFRSLGPAVMLQRACLRGVTSDASAIYYDFPSHAMAVVYRRLGIPEAGNMLRLARPLRVDARVRRLLRPPLLARGLTAVGNTLLGYRAHVPRNTRGISVAVHDAPFGEEFSELARATRSAFGVLVARSAEYLNWRYREIPFGGHTILVARRDGRLVGYAVIADGSGTDPAVIVDLFGLPDSGLTAVLARHALALIRSRGLALASIFLPDRHPWLRLFRRLGFQAREQSPVVIHCPDTVSGGPAVADLSTWFLMHGDQDA